MIVLNDNGMSISPNVGALSRYFNRIRLNPRLYHAREEVEDRLTKLPLGLGRRIERLGPEIKSAIKAYWAPGLFFEELDLAYMGVIDGHDVPALRDALHRGLRGRTPGRRPHPHGQGQGLRARRSGRPRVDGEVARGQAELDRQRPPAASEGRSRCRCSETDSPEGIERLEKPPAAGSPPQYTKVFADAMVAEAERDERVIGITAAMAGGTGLQKLADELPEQYYDVGIAEQNAVLLASGLALQGAKPVCAIYSTFLQRAFDQIIHDVCLQSLDVTFAMDRAGLVGDDGPTHHGAFDVSYFRPIPNVVRDGAARRGDAGPHAAHRDRPRRARRRCATRAARPRGWRCRRSRKLIPIGKGEVLAEGERVALLGYGYGVTVALEAAAILADHGLQATVADARFAKPLDGELAERLAREHDLLVTIEENVLPGGFGAAVLEHLEDAFAEGPGERARVLRVGLPDRYVTHGKPALLRAEVGLTGQSVADRVLAATPSAQPVLG